jgi:hypothetical protein
LNFTNVMYNDDFVPFKINFTIALEEKFVVRFKGSNRSVYMGNSNVIVEFHPNYQSLNNLTLDDTDEFVNRAKYLKDIFSFDLVILILLSELAKNSYEIHRERTKTTS